MKHWIRTGCLTLTGLLLFTCQDPLKGVELKFIDPLPTVVELRLKPEGGVLPRPSTISIVGSGAGTVVTPLNTTRFRLSNDGRLYLSLIPSVVPTANRPLRFTVVSRADSAYDVVYPVVLKNTNQRLLSDEWLHWPTKAPLVQVTGRADAAGRLQEALTAQTPTLNAGGGPTQLVLSAGLLLNDADGAVVTGPITLRLRQLDIRSVAQVAGSGILFRPVTANGVPTPTQQLATLVGGARLLAYNQDYQLVNAFDKPAQLSFRVNPQLVNASTKRPIQVNDPIALYSYDAALDQWRQETAGVVIRNARNELECVASLTHLPDWIVAAFTNPVCEAGPVFRISSRIPGGNLLYHCQVLDAVTNTVLPNTSGNTDFYTTITNGRTLPLYFLPTGSKVRLRVYDNESKGVVTSGIVNGCSATQVSLDLSSFVPPKIIPVPITIALQFPCKTIDASKLPTKAIYAQIRETGTTTWQDLPVMRYEAGKTEFSVETYDIKLGKTYDLQIGFAPGFYSITQPAQLVDTNKWTIRLKTHEFCLE